MKRKKKIKFPKCCYYCGSEKELTVDHLVPRAKEEIDTSDNLIYACRSCNSSKKDKDLLHFYALKKATPPINLLVRYLKLCYHYCKKHGLLDLPIEEIKLKELPFSLDLIPSKMPQPKELKYFVTDPIDLSIAIWNTEWATPGSKRAVKIKSILNEINADIICITEGYIQSWEDEGYVIASEADYGYTIKEGRRKAMLISKKPWSNVDCIGGGTMPPGRFCSGETFGINCFGVCIPWKSAHVATGKKNRATWEDHLNYLEALKSLLREIKGKTLVMGDFNQRVPRKYSPQHVYDKLIETFKPNFTISTAGKVSGLEKPVIDHLAVNNNIKVSSIVGIPSTLENVRLSDHDGVLIQISN